MGYAIFITPSEGAETTLIIPVIMDANTGGIDDVMLADPIFSEGNASLEIIETESGPALKIITHEYVQIYIIKDYDEHSKNEVKDIIGLVHGEYKSWRTTSFEHRSKLMYKAAEVLRTNKNKYAEIISLEMGKAITEARAEVEKCAWVCDYYAENAEDFLAPPL